MQRHLLEPLIRLFFLIVAAEVVTPEQFHYISKTPWCSENDYYYIIYQFKKIAKI